MSSQLNPFCHHISLFFASWLLLPTRSLGPQSFEASKIGHHYRKGRVRIAYRPITYVKQRSTQCTDMDGIIWRWSSLVWYWRFNDKLVLSSPVVSPVSLAHLKLFSFSKFVSVTTDTWTNHPPFHIHINDYTYYDFVVRASDGVVAEAQRGNNSPDSVHRVCDYVIVPEKCRGCKRAASLRGSRSRGRRVTAEYYT